jgi:predicted MFS family arabinose efflux permease
MSSNVVVIDKTVGKQSPALAYEKTGYRYYVLALLTLGYVFSFVDRQILAILQDPIKAELGLTDSHLGLLNGFAFAMFYVLFGLPIARWADKGNRRNIISLAVLIWSVMTALCGLAQNFVQMLLARMGVGIGEAGGSPPSHSMISDIFPPERRATALGVYSVGVNAGILLGLLAGGWLNEFYGWRVAFLAVGLPGIALAIILRLAVKEPPRGFSENKAERKTGNKAEGKSDNKAEDGKDLSEQESTAESIPSFMDVLFHLWSLKTFRHLAVACGLTAFAGYSMVTWMPSFLLRSHGMGTGEVGTWLALIAGLGGGAGTFLGSLLADRLGQNDSRWYIKVPAFCILISIPLLILTFIAGTQTLALSAYVLPACVITVYLAPSIAVTHSMVDNRMRALASAVFFFILNIVGLGLGPLLVGIGSDILEDSFGQDSLRYSLLFFVSISLVWALFHYHTAAKTVRSDLLKVS